MSFYRDNIVYQAYHGPRQKCDSGKLNAKVTLYSANSSPLHFVFDDVHVRIGSFEWVFNVNDLNWILFLRRVKSSFLSFYDTHRTRTRNRTAVEQIKIWFPLRSHKSHQ